jgi:hypothetical protein
MQQIRQPDAMQHLGLEPIDHREADVGAALGRVDGNPKRTPANGDLLRVVVFGDGVVEPL